MSKKKVIAYAIVAEHMTEHAYQELASALEADACRKVAPSEASAVEVLRELVAWGAHPSPGLLAIVDRARAVLAASGPDPMPVVRAAMRFDVAGNGQEYDAARRALSVECDKFRKAGGE